MRPLFSKTSLIALTLAASLLPAKAAEDETKGVQIPHTGIWVEQAKASEYLDNSTSYGRVFGDDEVLFITKVEDDSDRDRPKVGDILLEVDGRLVTSVKQLSESTTFRHKGRQDTSVITIVREDKDALVFLKIE